MIKTYKIDANEAVLDFNVGKAIVKAHFYGGRNGRGATMTTSNSIVQIAIETSKAFGETIKLVKAVKTEEDDNVTIEVGDKVTSTKFNSVNTNSKNTFENVNDVNGVVSILKTRGIKFSHLTSFEKLYDAVSKEKLYFPNVDWEEVKKGYENK
jgi:hypothetical protein